MNKVILMGRLTRDPEVRYAADSGTAVARYTLAVDRKIRREGEANADFLSCVAFGKSAEFAEKYFRQGIKIAISGHIQTGSYTNREGQKVYTTDIIIEEQEFAESKNADNAATSNTSSVGTGPSNGNKKNNMPPSAPNDGFMNIPDGVDEELPFT